MTSRAMRVAAVVGVVLGTGVIVSAVESGRGSEESESSPCAATRVDGATVRAGPFTGAISPEHDVEDGRFRLRVGAYRDVTSGLTQKIPWSVARGARVGRRLRIVARRLPPRSPRTFRQTLGRTFSPGDPKRWFFPSIMKPPAEGCWRLRFRSGRITGRLTVLVRR